MNYAAWWYPESGGIWALYRGEGVGSALESALESALGSALESALGSALESALGSALESA